MNRKEHILDFYNTFSCIADRCPITCCQEWKIAVDDDTFKRWKKLQKQTKDCLTELTEEKEGGIVMKLTKAHQCPHLSDKKLCELVRKYGETSISETCQVFPRVVHEFDEYKEYSLTSCCPEVVDLLAKRESVKLLGEEESEKSSLCEIRSLMVQIIQNKRIALDHGLMIGFYCLLELMEEDKLTPQAIHKYKDQENLLELSQLIQDMKFQPLDTFDENNELLLDIAENYRKQNLYTRFLEPIACKAEELIEGYDEEEIELKLDEFQKRYGQYEMLLRNYLTVEFYNTFLVPDSDLESLAIMMQWIGLEYVVIRQAIFLKWLTKEEKELAYEDVRDYIVVISRMTGYDQEDIYEYLENSFQDLLWDWGYFALVIGNRKR